MHMHLVGSYPFLNKLHAWCMLTNKETNDNSGHLFVLHGDLTTIQHTQETNPQSNSV